MPTEYKIEELDGQFVVIADGVEIGIAGSRADAEMMAQMHKYELARKELDKAQK